MKPHIISLIGCAVLLGSDVAAATLKLAGPDSAAITAAIERASPGDTVSLPTGVIELTEAIAAKSGIRLIGAGQEQTRIVYRGEKPSELLSLRGCEDVEVAHFTLDGEDNPLVRQGIGGNNSRRLRIHHLTVRDLANTGAFGPHGIYFSGENPTMENGVTDSEISDCRFQRIGLGAKYGGGIRLAWGSVRNRVLRNVVRDTGRGGIFGDHSAELTIRDNEVSGSGGTGLGIEIWGGCPRSVIEDNVVDHWISVDKSDRSAVRRNVIGADDGTLKGYGIEVIARD
ncbi:MAG: nitrous oxide reductase family maturation protein NosD, partial [Armatimonadota bacterium]